MTEIDVAKLRSLAENAKESVDGHVQDEFWDACGINVLLALLDRLEQAETGAKAWHGEVAAVTQDFKRVAAASNLSHGMLVIEREEHAETKARAERAEAAIERVRAVHREETRLNNWQVCAHCEVGMLQDPVDWPCDTIAALDAGKEKNSGN